MAMASQTKCATTGVTMFQDPGKLAQDEDHGRNKKQSKCFAPSPPE
jgi:hypothetical protein